MATSSQVLKMYLRRISTSLIIFLVILMHLSSLRRLRTGLSMVKSFLKLTAMPGGVKLRFHV